MTFDVTVVGSASHDTILVPLHTNIRIEKENIVLPIGSKFLVDELHTDVGGGGVNVSIGLSRLGLRTALICALGTDETGNAIKARFEKEHVHFLGQRIRGTSGQSTILSGFHRNRVIFSHKGVNDQLTKKTIPPTKWIYLGTLLGKSFDTLKNIATLARKRNIPCAFNPSIYLARKGVRGLKTILSATRVLIVNKEEAQALVNSKKDSTELLKLLNQHAPIVLITDGPRGAYVTDGTCTHHIRPPDVPIADTTGAGDAFSSAFVAALVLGHDIQTALQWGIIQANSVIQYFGATHELLNRTEIIRKTLKLPTR